MNGYSFGAVKALKTKENREKTGLFLAEGEKILNEIPISRIKMFFVSKTYACKHPLFTEQASAPVTVLKDSLIEQLSANKTPQGRIALCEKPPLPDIDTILDTCKGGFCVFCDGIQDPGNTGSIIRTSYAAGSAAVFLSDGCAEIFGAKTLQSASGAVFRVPIYEKANHAYVLNALKTRGVTVTAAVTNGGIPLWEARKEGAVAILLGSEAGGVSQEALSFADSRVCIPMPGGAESLNVAAAAAVLIYEYALRPATSL